MEDKIKEDLMFKIVDESPVSILEIRIDGSVYYREKTGLKKAESMEELTEILPQLFRELMRQQNELLTAYKKKLVEEIEKLVKNLEPNPDGWTPEDDDKQADKEVWNACLEQVKSIITK